MRQSNFKIKILKIVYLQEPLAKKCVCGGTTGDCLLSTFKGLEMVEETFLNAEWVGRENNDFVGGLMWIKTFQ